MSDPSADYQPATKDEALDTTNNKQDEYESRPGQDEIPVQADSSAIEDPIHDSSADSDEQLAKDDTDAIDKSNIIDSRTRGVTADYREPGDEEGLGDLDDGTNRVA